MSSYGLWLSAAGMKVNDHRQSVLANNMANANTTGFKQGLASIMQRQVESQVARRGGPLSHPVLDRLAGGLNVRQTRLDFSRGAIERTGKPLDVAIKDEGFFVISDGNETRYTRDGQFAINADGELVMAAGEGRWRVLDDNGQRIGLDKAGGPVAIGPDRTIRQGEETVAKLALMTTDDKPSLRKIGGNLFDAGDAAMVATDSELEPQAREESNVNVMLGLATMIEAARAYQMNARLIRLQDQMSEQLVQTVGRRAR